VGVVSVFLISPLRDEVQKDYVHIILITKVSEINVNNRYTILHALCQIFDISNYCLLTSLQHIAHLWQSPCTHQHICSLVVELKIHTIMNFIYS
jgi:hypothetical protein